MSVLLVKTTAELTALAGTATAGDTYFNSDTKNIRVWDGTNWMVYANDGLSLNSITSTSSLLLNGADEHVYLPPNNAYAFGTNDFSVVAWVKYTTISSTYSAIWDFRSSSMGVDPSLFISSNNPKLYHYTGDGYGASYNNDIGANTWNMITVVREAGVIRMYLGDLLVASGTNSKNYVNSNGIKIGIGGNNSYELTGNIDEFSVYNKALQAGQIKEIYRGQAAKDLDPLQPLTWLRFGEGDSGTTVTDHGNLGNHASLINNASFDTVNHI